MLASLRRAWPGARIDWLVQDTFAEAIDAHPMLTGVVHFRRARLGQEAARGGLHGVRALAGRLRATRYDVVIDAQGLFRSGWLAWATGAPWRVGHADAREGGWVFLTQRVRAPRAMHTVDRMLALVGAMGIEPVRDLRLTVGEGGRREASELLGNLGERGLVVLAPTTRWAGKRWRDGRWVEVADRLMDRGLAVAVVGGPGEREQCPGLADLVEQRPRGLMAIGRSSVGGLMGLIERARVVVALDSAAAHMAVGLGRPLVALFGPTDAARVGPYGRSEDVIQHLGPGEALDHKREAAGRALMDRIGASEVLAASLARLRG